MHVGFKPRQDKLQFVLAGRDALQRAGRLAVGDSVQRHVRPGGLGVQHQGGVENSGGGDGPGLG